MSVPRSVNGDDVVVDGDDERADLADAAGLAELERAVTLLQTVDLDTLDPADEMVLVRRLEVARRRLDHACDRLAGHLETSGAHGVDGHRDARAAVCHLGRLPSTEGRVRVQTARVLRRLPEVAAGHRRGAIPTAHVRAIVRTASNPRVQPFLDDADWLFAEQAAEETYADFCRWLKEWESLADADGADQAARVSHERRHAELVETPDGGFVLAGGFGGLEGASMKEIFERFVDAEALADWAEARALLGDAATPTDLRRTPRQRRADALFAVFRRAASASGESSAVPLVNILVDQATFERELRRAGGGWVPSEPHDGPSDRRCQTIDGATLRPSDVVAAALVGHVRRVLIDADSNVIDLGRRRRLFVGSSREAAEVQGALQNRDGLRCLWSGCLQRRRLQVDHVDPAGAGGRTDVANSLPLCGFHNRLKEHRWRPVRGPDGRWRVVRPDGSTATDAA